MPFPLAAKTFSMIRIQKKIPDPGQLHIKLSQ